MAEDQDEVTKLQTLLNQEDDDIDRDSFGNAAVGTQWNLVSGKWYRCWRTSKGLVNQTGFEDRRLEEALGMVDNSDLLLNEETYYRGDGSNYLDWGTKYPLRLDEDYKIFPPKAWKLIVDKYGVKPGSTIQRFSIATKSKETMVEVSLRELHLAVVLVPERRLVPPKPIFFSRKDTIKSIRARILTVFQGLFRQDFLVPGNFTLWKLNTYHTFEEHVKRQFEELETGAIVQFPGQILNDEAGDLDEVGLAPDAVIVAELKEAESNWLYIRNGLTLNKLICAYCQSKVENEPCQCYCKKVMDR